MQTITLKKKRVLKKKPIVNQVQSISLFVQKFEGCGDNREGLLALMAEIDAEKRLLKSWLTQLSSEPEGDYARGRKRQTNIRKIKDKISFLTEEREQVRKRLGSLKVNKKALNKTTNSRKPDFQAAFMTAAEIMLDEETFLEIEAKASEMYLSEWFFITF